MTFKTLLAVFMIATLGICGMSGGAAHSAAKAVITSQAFELQAARVRKEMEPPGRYDGVSSADRRAVDDQLNVISAILKRRGSSQALTSAEKVDVFNMQERINALLTGRDDHQICKVENKTGSHFKSKVCVSASDVESVRRAEIETAQRLYGLHSPARP